MSNPKVFEFAKEVGMTPLALMDKIREWQLPVKSHMAELGPEVLEVIKTKLNSPAGGEAAPAEKKKVAARKKAPAAAVAKKAEAPTPIKSSAVKAGTAAKTAAAAPAKTTKTSAKTAAAAPVAASTVVRRKKAEAAPEAEVETAVEEEAVVEAVQTKAVEADEAPVAAPVSKKETAPEIATEAPPAVVAVAATPAPEETEKKAVGPARKKEVSIGNSGVASATAPRRNIIGRMDLSRVSPQQNANRPDSRGARPAAGGAAGGANAGVNRPKSNIRPGFVQQAPPTTGFPETMSDFDRRKDDKRRKTGVGEATVATKTAEEGAVKHFDASEFRKREMVFQPKKKKGMLTRPAMKTQITQAKASKRVVKVNQTMKVSDLAQEMKIKAPDLIKVLMKNGSMASMNTALDFDTIALIAPDFGYEAVNAFKSAENVILEEANVGDESDRVIRPPVVTIMGHVDHGKTSLLDTIRNANVASGEAGGITQHIGAYQVTAEDGGVITFLDTPGHEAFTAMRARGANVTDIAIIVVAADDGVMPQTAEAISHAKAAGVPMIVAINKMDKPGANPDKVKQQLTEYEVVPEEWGGTTIFVNVSALKKTGIKELLEQINLIAEVGELKGNPNRLGTGAVIESRLEKGRGPMASILVKDGTVKVGQHIVAGSVYGKVKSLMNYKGERVLEAGPGTPVEVLGLSDVPAAGDVFDIVADEKTAEQVVQIRKDQVRRAQEPQAKLSLEDIFSKVKQGDVKELNVILKTDVAGSEEAIKGMFKKLATNEVKLKIVHSAVGGINENDVMLASTSKGIVVGFNTRPDGNATNKAKQMGVDVRSYTIVYELMDEMKKAMAGLLTPDIVEKVMGRAEVRNTFTVPKIGMIAGCSVTDGKIARSNLARLIRDGKIVFEGKISSLKRFKDDAREVATGFECGIGIENFNDVKVGDVIEAYVKEEVARELTMIQAQP